MAEIEIGVRERQCLARCATQKETLITEVAAMGAKAQCPSMWHRVCVYSGRGSEAKSSLRFVITVSLY